MSYSEYDSQTTMNLQKIEEFIAGPHRSTWLRLALPGNLPMGRRTAVLEMYIRKSERFLEGHRYVCFDIANVTAEPRGTGAFSHFLAYLILLLRGSHFSMLYVENVINDRFFDFLTNKRAFKVAEPGFESEIGRHTLACVFYPLKEQQNADTMSSM